MMLAVSNIRNILAKQYKEDPNADMIEIIGASFIADEEAIFGIPNEEYIAKEIEWYESQSRNVFHMENPPKIWKDVADGFGTINSNYGWCVFSNANHNQYNAVRIELAMNTNSRRGVMIYNRPSMHIDATRNGMNDFMCTNAVNYFIRDNKLQVVVQMRSNDAWAGYRNDYAWQKYIQEKLANDLGIEIGDIHWNAASLHVYPRQYYLIDHYVKTGERSISKDDYRKLYPESRHA